MRAHNCLLQGSQLCSQCEQTLESAAHWWEQAGRCRCWTPVWRTAAPQLQHPLPMVRGTLTSHLLFCCVTCFLLLLFFFLLGGWNSHSAVLSPLPSGWATAISLQPAVPRSPPSWLPSRALRSWTWATTLWRMKAWGSSAKPWGIPTASCSSWCEWCFWSCLRSPCKQQAPARRTSPPGDPRGCETPAACCKALPDPSERCDHNGSIHFGPWGPRKRRWWCYGGNNMVQFCKTHNWLLGQTAQPRWGPFCYYVVFS